MKNLVYSVDEIIEFIGHDYPVLGRNLAAGMVQVLNGDPAMERGVELHAFELIQIPEYCIYRIYQLPVEHHLCFWGLGDWERYHDYPRAEEYNFVYQGVAREAKKIGDKNYHFVFLENLYHELNVNHPKDYTTRSLSVSDVVVLDYFKDGEHSTYAYFVDSFGFKEITFHCEPVKEPFQSDYLSKKFLEENGFSCDPYRLLYNETDVRNYVEEVIRLKEAGELPYIDGIVFSIDNMTRRKKLGVTSKYPFYSMALKFANKGKVSTEKLEKTENK